jgi:hypothetical protein
MLKISFALLVSTINTCHFKGMFIVRKEAIASLAKHYYNKFRINAIYILLIKSMGKFIFCFLYHFVLHSCYICFPLWRVNFLCIERSYSLYSKLLFFKL